MTQHAVSRRKTMRCSNTGISKDWFEIDYCLTKEFGPKDRFLRTHKLRVYRQKPALHYYFNEIADVIRNCTKAACIHASIAPPQIYLAYEQISLTAEQWVELWAPKDANIIRSFGSPENVLDKNYEIQGNDQLVVITDPPEPALIYQWAAECSPSEERFPFHPRRWLALHNMEPVVKNHAPELRERRTWELVRYYLEERYRLHAEPAQKKANLEGSHLEGALWEEWVKWKKEKGNLKKLDELDMLTVQDRIVLMRKPSPKGFLQYKPSDFFALEVRFGSEEAALQAVIEQDPRIYEGSRGNLPVGKRIHASLADTDKMIRPDLTKAESCNLCGSKWHFTEFCKMHRIEAQEQKGRLITPFPTGIPKLFFKTIAREDKTTMIDQGHKLYYDPEEQLPEDERTLFVSTKQVNQHKQVVTVQERILDENVQAFDERLTLNELDSLSELTRTEPEHCFVISFGEDIDDHKNSFVPTGHSYTTCKLTFWNKNIVEIFLQVIKTALVRRHKTFTVVFSDWLSEQHIKYTNWYNEFIQGGDEFYGWDLVVPEPIRSPFEVNREKSGIVITRWTSNAAIKLYKNLSIDRYVESHIENCGSDRNLVIQQISNQWTKQSFRWLLHAAHMQTSLEWEMIKIGRKHKWKIKSVPI